MSKTLYQPAGRNLVDAPGEWPNSQYHEELYLVPKRYPNTPPKPTPCQKPDRVGVSPLAEAEVRTSSSSAVNVASS